MKWPIAAFSVWILVAPSAFGHVRVSPNESAPGEMQRYTVRVPTERDSPTVRVEMDFPVQISVVSFEAAQGWKVEEKKDAQGKIVRAIWSGGSIPFSEYREFHFSANNPATEMKLEWKAVQIYEDGTRSEWTGPEGSNTPGPLTMVKKPLR